MTVAFELNGSPVDVGGDAGSLLAALRDQLGVRSAKDGCSPQGQCGCCTVWIDEAPRVACVTPIGRVAGRSVTTIEGLRDADHWAQAFCAAGASQCGFCSPGIVMRLAALSPAERSRSADVERALLAHLCRCTGWQSIVRACAAVAEQPAGPPGVGRDVGAAEARARLEGGVTQRVDPDVVLGRGGFAEDLAPADALVAMPASDGSWKVAETVTAVRVAVGTVPGRRSSAPLTWPIDVPSPPADGPAPDGWARTLCTTWVEPAYLEPDAAWCSPGGEPASPLGNGGAFGGKSATEVTAVAQRLADEHGRAVRAVLSREDTVRRGPKRPPLAIGVRADGSGIVRIARPAVSADEDDIRSAIAAVAPRVEVEFVPVVGPPAGAAVRAAGWAEVAAVVSSLGDAPDRVVSPTGAIASAWWVGADRLAIEVACGAVLDDVVLRSYCEGAAHMALGLVRSEGLAVGEDGVPLDLTIRSFGVLRAKDTPDFDVRVVPSDAPAVNGSDAVFAAVLAAAWRRAAWAPRWPTAR